MFIGRVSERKILEEIYASQKSGLVILYGRPGIGKTALASEFIAEKDAFYYLCRDCTDREQAFILRRELEYGKVEGENGQAVGDTLQKAVLPREDGTSRHIIVLDEFHLCMKGGTLKDVLLNILTDKDRFEHVLFVLCSSSVNWVENEMVGELGAAARYIIKFMKLKELGFMELGQWFPRFSIEECIAVNAVTGGVPAYLKRWDERKSAGANIKKLFLEENAPFYREAENVLNTELRELAAYNTILYSLAMGRCKLNDIYLRTGFSRAKISVYIKSLIRLDVVEKVFSADAGSNDNAQKGLYRIRDNFLDFWYRFVFCNRSAIALGKSDELYEDVIRTEFREYQRESFAELCLEYLRLMARHKRLKADYDRWGSWHGKTGRIDILAADRDGGTLAGICNWGDKRPNADMYNEILDILHSAGIKPAEVYLFTQKPVSAEAMSLYQKQDLIKVVELKDM
jgi:AAA+ ATPase superfamily predicted ATPase